MSEKRKALIVANFDYQDPALRRLTAPSRDAAALERVLKDPAIGGFEVETLLNETSSRVSQSMEEFFRFSNPKPEDLLLFYFSGHGLTDEDGQLYFATADTRLVGQNLRGTTAVGAEFVNHVMQRSRSRRQVLLLDCCYSGAFAEALRAKGDRQSGVARHFQGEGRMVLTASGARQFSLESKEEAVAAPSIYTGLLVQGLATGEADRDGDGWVSLDELHDYLLYRVSAAAPQQTPSKSGYVEGQLYIARSPVVRPVELPLHFHHAIENPLWSVREGVIRELAVLLRGSHEGLRRAASQALIGLKDDPDSRVSGPAKECLARYSAEEVGSRQASVQLGERPGEVRFRLEREEKERQETESREAERLVLERAALAREEKEEKERRLKEHMGRLAQKADAERLALERAAAARGVQEEKERRLKEQVGRPAQRLGAERLATEEGAPPPKIQPPVNHVARLVGVLFSPKQTFASIAERPSWLAPLLLMVILGVFTSALLNTKVNWGQYFRHKAEESARFSQLSEEQKDQALAQQIKFWSNFSYGAGVVTVPISVLILALIYWRSFNFLWGTGWRFETAFGATAHALLPMAISSILALIILPLKSYGDVDPENIVATSLRAYLPQGAPKALVTLGGSLELFWIWSLVLVAIGLAAANPKRINPTESLGTVFGLWVVWVLAKVAWALI
jgi:hypothetical protein